MLEFFGAKFSRLFAMEVDSPTFHTISPISKRNSSSDDEADEGIEGVKFHHAPPIQRKLTFEPEHLDQLIDKLNNNYSICTEDISDVHELSKVSSTPNRNLADSPPYKRAKLLPSFDSSTPYGDRSTPPFKDTSLLSSVCFTPRLTVRRPRLFAKLNSSTPVNPFTPSGRVVFSENKKRREQRRRKVIRGFVNGTCSEDSGVVDSSSKNVPADESDIFGPSFYELETSRFTKEFRIDEFIANGSYGLVYKCTNYLDGMEYAVKKTAKPVSDTNYEWLARREVFAHAALRSHPHIVAYYSSWIEQGHLYIQTEYCNGGNLEQLIKSKHEFTESRLKRLMNHVSKGLKFIHSQNLAHMDIKPANILVSRANRYDSSDEDIDDENEADEEHDIVYKIGDLGLVIVADEPYDVEDGDCRYMAKELLNDNYDNLKKSDIFAFGMTLYEAAGGGPLPKNGDTWQDLRNGKVPDLVKHSSHFNQLIKQMLHPEPEERPDITYVLQQTRVTKSFLQQAILSYKMKHDFYAHHLAAQNSLNRIPKIVID